MYKKSGPAPRGNNKNSSAGFKRNGPGGSAKPYGSKDGGKKEDNPFKRGAPSRSDDGRPPRGKSDAGAKKRAFPKTDGDKPFRKDSDKPYKKDGGKPFSKDGDKPYKRDGDKPFKRDGDKPYAKRAGAKPFDKGEDGQQTGWKRSSESGDDKKPFPKRVKPFPKKDDRPFNGRPSAKPFDASKAKPTKDIYDPLEISAEKRNNKKAPVRKNDPSRAYKKETNEPISSRNGDSVRGKDKAPKKRTEKTDEKRPYKKSAEELAAVKQKPFDRKQPKEAEDEEEAFDEGRPDKFSAKKKRHHHHHDEEDEEDEEAGSASGPQVMPLNKYLAHSGVCSRRDAAILVKEGKVKLNDVVVTDPGHKVEPDDVVTYNDKKLTIQKGMVYILLNKPKDYITTNEDPQGRKTVMDLLMGADAERLFPVGRLDRNTSGLLLITNDGDLTQKLAHPSYKVKKIYQVTLDKPLTKADFDKIINGLELEDGVANVDALAYLETKNELGIEIHIGKNRIVRRIFESLGYVVEKLDRVMYGNLTKKNLPRGKWRYLNEREIVLLKHFKS